MTILSRDGFELSKLTFELPKISLNISLFLATAGAFLVRGTFDQTPNWQTITVGALYLGGILATVVLFFASYNFLTKVYVISKNSTNDTDYKELLDTAISEKYPFISVLSRVSVLAWITIISVTIAILNFT